MRFSVGPFKNWIALDTLGWTLSITKGRHTKPKKLVEFWSSPFITKYRLDTVFCGIILVKRGN